jgi:hypothetical protein
MLDGERGRSRIRLSWETARFEPRALSRLGSPPEGAGAPSRRAHREIRAWSRRAGRFVSTSAKHIEIRPAKSRAGRNAGRDPLRGNSRPDGSLYTANLRQMIDSVYIARQGRKSSSLHLYGFRYAEIGDTREPLDALTASWSSAPGQGAETRAAQPASAEHRLPANFDPDGLSPATAARDGGYLGSRTACFNADVASFFTKWLRRS